MDNEFIGGEGNAAEQQHQQRAGAQKKVLNPLLLVRSGRRTSEQPLVCPASCTGHGDGKRPHRGNGPAAEEGVLQGQQGGREEAEVTGRRRAGLGWLAHCIFVGRA